MFEKHDSNFFFNNFWRVLTNIWTIVFIVFACLDFFSGGEYKYLLSPSAIIYGAVLSIFVGTKEFARWYNVYSSKKHPGEWAAILWSLVVFILAIMSLTNEGKFSISTEVISVYIMVLTVFAVTQSSKRIYLNKRAKK